MADKDVVPRDISETLKRLLFISKAQKGKKVNFRSRTYSDTSSWWHWLSRQISYESHVSLVSNLERDVSDSVSTLNRYNNNNTHTELVIAMLDAMRGANQGMSHLAETYRDASQEGTVSDIEAQQTILRICIETAEKRLIERGVLKRPTDQGPLAVSHPIPIPAGARLQEHFADDSSVGSPDL